MAVFIAAQWHSGDPVDAGQPVDPAADQDRVDGGGGHTEPVGDLDRAEPVSPPQPGHPPHHRLWGAGGAVVWA